MCDHSVTDESYNVIGDFWEDTESGDKRTLALEHRDSSLVYVCFPNSLASNNSSLFGSVVIKRVTTEFFLKKDQIDINLDADIDERPSYEVKSATPQRPSCSVCGQTFSMTCNLSRHMKCQHSEKKFKCPSCNRLFSRLDNMKLHRWICKK
jgi:uncharacterized Zn-finger protein